MKKLLLLSLLFVSFASLRAQTVQSTFLVTASFGQVSVQKVNNNIAFSECLSCASTLMASCSASCVLNAVIDQIAAGSSEDIREIQVIKYTNGTFAAYDRIGLEYTGASPVTSVCGESSLTVARDALLNALAVY